MTADWYPGAIKKLSAYNGGTMVGGPPRGVLHETETTALPGYSGGKSSPHLTLMPDGIFYQHIPFSKAARALRNAPGGVQTNRQGSVNIQIEVVANSNYNDWTPAQIMKLRAFVLWAHTEWGIPATFPLGLGGSEQYGLNNPLEMSNQEWLDFSGWCSHMHVPENTHWDVGMETGVGGVFDGLEEDMEVVRHGAKGKIVGEIQLALLAWNPNALPSYGADKDFGDETQTWVENWQKDAGLEGIVTLGEVGGLTYAKLCGVGTPGPKGDPGDRGPRGFKGADGPQGPAYSGALTIHVPAIDVPAHTIT